MEATNITAIKMKTKGSFASSLGLELIHFFIDRL